MCIARRNILHKTDTCSVPKQVGMMPHSSGSDKTVSHRSHHTMCLVLNECRYPSPSSLSTIMTGTYLHFMVDVTYLQFISVCAREPNKKCPSFCSHCGGLMSHVLLLIKYLAGDGWRSYANVEYHLPREFVATSAIFWKASRNIPAAIMVCLEENKK